jgi:prepilin-type N-terminal cleavage/methylation domain-containing protein/prepilin-type processing-associated H-X9-DG protein
MYHCEGTMKRRGFTLIEILVVLVIILVMAGILFPVLANAKKKANQVKCMTQLRQLSMAIQMYAGDHDEVPPLGGYDVVTPEQPGTTPQQRVQWHDSIVQTGYLKSWDVLTCPSATNRDYRYSYGTNRFVMGWMKSTNLDSIPYPAHTVLVTEKLGLDWVAWEPSLRGQYDYWTPLDPRHNDQLNILYCDGHVKKVAVGEMVEGGPILWRIFLNQ